MKDKNIESNQSNDGADFLLKAYAAQNKGKYGSDEDMFSSLREDYRREKAEKRKAGRGIRRRLLIPIGAAAAVLVILGAVLIPLLRPDDSPQYQILDGLYVIPVTETQLISQLGFSPAIPRPEGYTIDAFNIYKNEGGEIKAYSFHYSTDMEVTTKKIEILCIINNDFTFSKEKAIEEEGKNKMFASKVTRIYFDDKDGSLCRFAIKDDKYIISLNKHDANLLSCIITEFNII